jgi:hypothetical protein
LNMGVEFWKKRASGGIVHHVWQNGIGRPDFSFMRHAARVLTGAARLASTAPFVCIDTRSPRT